MIVLHHHDGAPGVPLPLPGNQPCPAERRLDAIVEPLDPERPLAQGAEDLKAVEGLEYRLGLLPLLQCRQIGAIAFHRLLDQRLVALGAPGVQGNIGKALPPHPLDGSRIAAVAGARQPADT